MNARHAAFHPSPARVFRLLLTIALALPAVLAAAGAPAPARAQSTGDRLVLAFYYTWFDEATWTLDRLSDLPAQTYVSSDRGAMGRHIDQAKAAGIDAFLVAWYGPGGGNQTEPNLAALLEEAAARNFKIGILFDTDSPFLGGTDATIQALQHALGTHANHPAFLRADGRPVIFFWRTQMYGVGAWQAIRQAAEPGYGSLWFSDGVDTSYLSVFDGHFLYSNTWNPPADLAGVNGKFAAQVAAMREATGAGKLWVATAMPGYNDVRVRGGAGFATDRAGGSYYESSWAAAIGSAPNWVVITSFNEWPEGSYIEPSAAFGDQYIGLTAKWSAQFKSGLPGPAVAPPAPLPAPVEVAPPAPGAPTLVIGGALVNVREGPGLEFPVLGQAAPGAALEIEARSAPAAGTAEWWRVRFGEVSGWVLGELATAGGPLEQVPDIEPAAPVAAADAANESSAAAPPTTAATVTAPATLQPIGWPVTMSPGP